MGVSDKEMFWIWPSLNRNPQSDKNKKHAGRKTKTPPRLSGVGESPSDQHGVGPVPAPLGGPSHYPLRHGGLFDISLFFPPKYPPELAAESNVARQSVRKFYKTSGGAVGCHDCSCYTLSAVNTTDHLNSIDNISLNTISYNHTTKKRWYAGLTKIRDTQAPGICDFWPCRGPLPGR